MTPLVAHREDGFRLWVARVAELVQARLGMELEEIAGLALRERYDVGESPAEFLAGCVRAHLDEVETRPGHR